jgi:hypothetical protein
MNYDNDLFEEFKLSKRKPLNLIYNLIGRELGTYSCSLYTNSIFNSDYSNRNEKTIFNHLKKIYLTVAPNYSILNVKTPNCYLKRFSPDGRYLIAYNQHLNGIQIFSFLGSSSGIADIDNINKNFQSQKQSKNESNIFNKIYANDKTDFNDFESDQFRFKAFSTYFREIANLKLIDNGELINRECALFYNNSHLIVASSEYINDEALPQYSDLATNNESIHYSTVENYTIYLVDIKKAKLSDKLKFNADKINLTNNQSLCLFKNTFAVLSLQNQTIHVYNIVKLNNTSSNNSKFKFVPINLIGRFSFPDDAEWLNIQNTNNPQKSSRRSSNNSPNNSNRLSNFSQQSMRGFTETSFTSMKNRIISHFYKEAVQNNTLNQFYVNLNTILNLKMYRMQLLDDRHIIIKYVNLDQLVTQKSSITITTHTTTNNGIPNVATSGANAQAQPTNPIVNSNNPIESINNTSNNIIANSNTNNVNIQQNNSTTLTTNWGITTLQNVINENTVPFYFVIYDMNTARILNILRNTSAQLLDVFENFQDYFSLSNLDGYYSELNHNINSNYAYGCSYNYHTLASNNIYAKQIYSKHVKSVSKFNTQSEMTKCLLSLLPISSQSYSTSPYLDHGLFSYDEKLISNLERPKPIGDQIIKFNNRETGRLAFKMYPGLQTASTQNNNLRHHHSASSRRLVAVIWHPREPFCISVQRASTEYNVNFHVFSKNNLI